MSSADPRVPPATHGICFDLLTAPALRDPQAGLVDLLRACVDGGASLGFFAPMAEDAAIGYWRSLGPAVTEGSRLVLLATEETTGRVVGSGQLAFDWRPTGRHRAEVCKLMVLPSHRRRGIAARLMSELERLALAHGSRLLYLDTSEGPGGACEFYEALGWTYAGGIPGWASDPDGGDARKNAIYFKRL